MMDMKWSEGKLERLKVVSKAGMPLQLRYNGVIKKISTTKSGVYQLDAALNKL